MTTQPPDLKKLREVAEKATPGPWHRNIPPASHYNTIFSGRNTHVLALTPDNKHVEANAEFVTTFNPQTILALLDAYEASARDAERWSTFLGMVDPDKVPGGFTIYYAIDENCDQVCYDTHVTELVDEHIGARHATHGD